MTTKVKDNERVRHLSAGEYVIYIDYTGYVYRRRRQERQPDHGRWGKKTYMQYKKRVLSLSCYAIQKKVFI